MIVTFVILSKAKDLRTSWAGNCRADWEILHCVQNDCVDNSDIENQEDTPDNRDTRSDGGHMGYDALRSASACYKFEIHSR